MLLGALPGSAGNVVVLGREMASKPVLVSTKVVPVCGLPARLR